MKRDAVDIVGSTKYGDKAVLVERDGKYFYVSGEDTSQERKVVLEAARAEAKKTDKGRSNFDFRRHIPDNLRDLEIQLATLLSDPEIVGRSIQKNPQTFRTGSGPNRDILQKAVPYLTGLTLRAARDRVMANLVSRNAP